MNPNSIKEKGGFLQTASNSQLGIHLPPNPSPQSTQSNYKQYQESLFSSDVSFEQDFQLNSPRVDEEFIRSFRRTASYAEKRSLLGGTQDGLRAIHTSWCLRLEISVLPGKLCNPGHVASSTPGLSRIARAMPSALIPCIYCFISRWSTSAPRCGRQQL